MSKILKATQNKTSLYIADYSSEGKEQHYRLVFDMNLKDNWVYEYLIESCVKRAHDEGRFTVGWLEDFFVALELKYDLEWYQEGHDEIPKDFFDIKDDIIVALYAPVAPLYRPIMITMDDLNEFNEKLDNMTATLKKMSNGE